MIMEKQNWFQKFMGYLFFPQIIANIFNALSMDDKGYSLKKIMACYATIMAGKCTVQWACKENAIAFTIVWLIWAGILVGIYSIADITNAAAKLKGTANPNEPKETTKIDNIEKVDINPKP